jgi:pilus assembly protein CpaC
MKKGGTAFTTGLVAALIVIMVSPVWAQVRPVAAARATGAVASIEENAEEIDLLVGRSAVIRTERPIKRVSLPKPEIADALVTSPNELLVHGKLPGTISLLVWGDTGRISSYKVIVQRDLSSLEERVRQLFPGEPIKVTSNGADVVLSGVVSSDYVAEKATSLALGYVEKKENVVNLLRQDEGLESNQVLLRVRFAEVSRSAMQELGASFFTGAGGYKDWIARTTTGQFPAPDFDDEKGLVFSDFLNILAFNTKEQLGTVVRALQTKGLFQSLAEPNLVTQNGKEATFLAGGEFPIPVLQGGANQGVTIMFKEFGVRLRFTPTITGDDTVHLKVAPEVSALDFANAVSMDGFRVPAISTRRTETEVELRDGQTFAIAGLIDNSVNQTIQKIPGLGDIPILGLLFKSRAYQKNATELVVMITPQILRRDSVGVTDHLPRMPQTFIPYEQKTNPPPAPAFSTPEARSVAPVGDASADAATMAPNAAPSQPALSKAELKALERTKAEDEKRAREEAKVEAARLARERVEAEKAAKIAAEEAKKQAEIDRKAAERQAAIDREEAKRAEKAAIEEAKRQAELDREQAELDRKRAAEEARQAERDRKEQEKLEKEREKLERERAKRAAEEQEIADKLEAMRAEAERKKQEERREEQEKLQRERAKRETWPRLRSRI